MEKSCKIRISGAFATKTSITMISKIKKGWYATMAKEYQGGIKHENCKARIEYNDDSVRNEIKFRVLAMATIAVMLVCAYQISMVYKNLMFYLVTFAFIADSIFWHGSIAFYLTNLWKVINQKKVRKMHAAIHKVLNAYDKLQSVPNADEAQTYSSFIENCDDAKNSLGITTLFFMFIAGWVSEQNMVPEKVLVIYGMILLGYAVVYRYGLYKYASWYSVSEPNRHQISMAIIALEEQIQFVEEVNKDENAVIENENIRNIFITHEEATTV